MLLKYRHSRVVFINTIGKMQTFAMDCIKFSKAVRTAIKTDIVFVEGEDEIGYTLNEFVWILVSDTVPMKPFNDLPLRYEFKLKRALRDKDANSYKKIYDYLINLG